jgi:cell wall-associated NlpC family hydrolase
MKLHGATLEVGLQDGGLALFDVGTKQNTMFIKGEGIAPAKDVTMLGNHPWWVLDGTQFVRTAIPGITRPIDIDLSDSGLVGPIRRLSVWQEMIVAHADNGIRFIEPQTQQVLTPEQVLPPDVASLANQGVVTTSWKDGAGLFVVIRRYAARTNPKPGEAKELGMLTAWSAPWRGDYKLLGSYTCDIVDFKDAPGPEVRLNGPSGPTTLPHGTGPIGNIQVNPDGIVALNNDEALTIPFYKDNWVTQRVTTSMAPHYAQETACSDSDMWWVNDGKLVRASLEDGGSEVFVPRSKDPVLSIAADEDGAWVLSSSGVNRISEDDDSNTKLYVKYQVGSDTAQPAYGGQERLAWVLKTAQRSGGHKIATDTPYDFVEDALKSAGVPAKRRQDLIQSKGDDISELQYGDVIVEGKQAAIYVGNGQELTAQNGGLTTLPVSLDQGASIHRFFLVGGRIPFGAHALPIVDIGPVFPIGVNRPDPRLGTDLFVHVDPGSPYDHPYLQSHYRLLQIAEQWIGTPYRWGGSSLDGTDCSGFVTSVYKELGIKLPRFSQDIARAPFGEVVFDELHFGDVLVYPDPKHCAIYIGDGKTIETTRGAVGYSNVYRRHCAYVRRFLFE